MLNGSVTVALAASLSAATPAASADPQERISHDQLEALVAGPAARLENGDIEGAAAQFETLLAAQVARHGPHSVAVADHLMAFGLALFGYYRSERLAPEARRRSLAYFARAVPVYRAAFRSPDEEVALAIITYADAAATVNPDDPPPELDPLLEEAYRIRVVLAGADSEAAAMTLVRLADVRGAPSRARRDPGAIAQSASLYRQAMPVLSRQPARNWSSSPFEAHFRMAQMYVRNGRLADAVAVIEEAQAFRQSVADPDGALCARLGHQMWRFREFLTERGQAAAADRLYRRVRTPAQCSGLDLRVNPYEG